MAGGLRALPLPLGLSFTGASGPPFPVAESCSGFVGWVLVQHQHDPDSQRGHRELGLFFPDDLLLPL